MDFLAVDTDQHDKRQHAAAGFVIAAAADLGAGALGAGRPVRVATALAAGWGAGALKEWSDRGRAGHDCDVRDFLATGYGATLGVVVVEGTRYALTLRAEPDAFAVGGVVRW